MATLWIELKKAVQFFTNPFFSSMEVLKECMDTSVIKNRLQLMEAMNDLMVEYTIHNENFLFSIATADGKAIDFSSLLREVKPSFGDDFVQNGDILTFDEIKKQTDPEYFRLAGLFFQEILLYGIAGFDKRTMNEVNENNRYSMLEVLGHIFRLPCDIGLVHLRVAGVKSGRRKVVQPQEIRSGHGQRLYKFLTASKPSEPPPAQPNATSSSSEAAMPQSESETYQLRSSRSNSLTQPASTNKVTRSTSSSHSARNGTRKRPFEDLTSPVSTWPGDDLVHSHTPHRTSRGTTPREKIVWSPLPSGTSAVPTPHRTKNPFTPPPESSVTYGHARSALLDVPVVDLPRLQSPSHGKHKWITEHSLVGTRVAGERHLPSNHASHSLHSSAEESSLAPRILCKGTIVAFAPSQEGPKHTNKGTFRVKWADPRLAKDELSLQEVQEASRMFDEIEGWTANNPSVGQRVAGIFPHQRKAPTCARGLIVPLSRVEDVYVGRVVKYQHPSSARAEDQLYHVQWCDGDVEDYDQSQLQEAQNLYIAHRSKFTD